MDNLQKNKYNYVYLHVHPETQEVVYVGMGTAERAWEVKRREVKVDHYQWILELLSKGYIPSDWVQIELQGLDRKEAQEKETELINLLGPRFNTSASWAAKKYTPDDVRHWMDLRKQGLTYKEIQDKTQAPAMVVMRALKGHTAAYRSIVNG